MILPVVIRAEFINSEDDAMMMIIVDKNDDKSYILRCTFDDDKCCVNKTELTFCTCTGGALHHSELLFDTFEWILGLAA
jgi:hypothetical protein